MLIGVFKSNQKLVNVLTLVLTIALWLPAFFNDLEFSELITTNIKWLDIIIAILLITGQSIYLNVIVNEYRLVKENSHLASLMFVFINGCCLIVLNFNQVIIANTFVLVAFHQLLRMYNAKNNYAIVFNVSFLLSLAGLIYFPCILYFFLLWITLMYIATPKWRDFIISLIGLSIPIIYLMIYKFVFGDPSDLSLAYYLIPIFDVHWIDFSQFSKIFFITLGLVLLLSFFGLTSTLGKSVARVKRMLVVVAVMFLIGMLTLFLNSTDYIATFIMMSIPMGIILANFFQNLKKRWLGELLFIFLLTGVVLSYFS